MDSKQIKTQISEFFNKNKLKILIGVVVLLIIITLNYFLRINKKNEPITTRNPFATIMEPKESFPTKLYIESEALIINFANKASKGDYEGAYDYLSTDCKSNIFPTLDEFKKYAEVNFPENSRYEVIPYSKVGTIYIYQVKVFEDFLSTGLTYSDYSYIDLKMAINEDIKGEKTLSIGGYMGTFPVNSVFENDYIKIEILQKKAFYTEEIYIVKITNRTENEIILRDFTNNSTEIQLSIPGDVRDEISKTEPIILSSYETKTILLNFPKFFDEISLSNSIVFSAIRVIKPGKTKRYNLDDILAKFSVEVEIVY